MGYGLWFIHVYLDTYLNTILYFLDGLELERVTYIKNLGFSYSSNLFFSPHIDMMINIALKIPGFVIS